MTICRVFDKPKSRLQKHPSFVKMKNPLSASPAAPEGEKMIDDAKEATLLGDEHVVGSDTAKGDGDGDGGGDGDGDGDGDGSEGEGDGPLSPLSTPRGYSHQLVEVNLDSPPVRRPGKGLRKRVRSYGSFDV